MLYTLGLTLDTPPDGAQLANLLSAAGRAGGPALRLDSLLVRLSSACCFCNVS